MTRRTFTLRVKNIAEKPAVPMITSFRKDGFSYSQIARSEKAAIYEQKDLDGDGVWYEVIKIRIKAKNEFKGLIYPRRETYPSKEEWGSKAWSPSNLENAKGIFFELVLFETKFINVKPIPKRVNQILAQLQGLHPGF